MNLDNKPFSSGPYKITKNTPGVELVAGPQRALGPEHRPGTPPVPRPVRLVLRRRRRRAQTNRVIADTGDDAAAVATDAVPA